MNETASSGTFIKVDFRYFISLALQNKIPWQSLPAILQDFTQTAVESKQVIKVLLKKLQELHSELEKYKKESNQNEEIIIEDDGNVEEIEILPDLQDDESYNPLQSNDESDIIVVPQNNENLKEEIDNTELENEIDLEPLEVNRVPENEIIHQLKSNDESDSIIANQNIEDLNEEIDDTELENEIVSVPPLEEIIVPKGETHEQIEKDLRIPKKERCTTTKILQSNDESAIIIGIQSSKDIEEIYISDLENETDLVPLEGNRKPENETHEQIVEDLNIEIEHELQDFASIHPLQCNAIEPNSGQNGAKKIKNKPKNRQRRRDTVENYHCTYCRKGYKTKNGVSGHINRMSPTCKQQHSNSNTKAVWEDELERQANKIKCETCKKGFKTKESLRVHKIRSQHKDH